MIYPQVSIREWTMRYKISVSPVLCAICNNPVFFTKPIALKDYRGLEAEQCTKCGHDSGIFRVVPMGDALKIYKEIF